uniref:Uncharacterized protein n=1 Tax=Oryzias sinensis TaxID=183150 RepID=A0A8C7XEI7_9TELE
MLITMLTAMYMMVKVVESIGTMFAPQEEPLRYMVSQPLPWQVHSVSHSRKSSKAEEVSQKKTVSSTGSSIDASHITMSVTYKRNSLWLN